MTASAEQQMLADAAVALRSFALRALTVKATLDKPYPDSPERSPWSAFIEAEARRAHDVSRAIRAHLKAQGVTIPRAADSHATHHPDDAEFPATLAGGHALIIEFGDEEMFGQCSCGDPLGNLVIRPNESVERFASLWEQHVMRLGRTAELTP